jgi:hypothetical protein
MKLFGLGLGLGTKLFPHPHTDFKNIFGYDDLKEIVKRALDSEENYNLLFVGAPASAKTLFLQGILEIREDGVYMYKRFFSHFCKITKAWAFWNIVLYNPAANIPTNTATMQAAIKNVSKLFLVAAPVVLVIFFTSYSIPFLLQHTNRSFFIPRKRQDDVRRSTKSCGIASHLSNVSLLFQINCLLWELCCRWLYADYFGCMRYYRSVVPGCWTADQCYHFGIQNSNLPGNHCSTLLYDNRLDSHMIRHFVLLVVHPDIPLYRRSRIQYTKNPNST